MKTHWIINNGPPGGFQWIEKRTSIPGTEPQLEAIIDEPNFKSIWWLEEALAVSRSVARIKTPTGSATGFLIAPNRFITNNHVFENKEDAKGATLQFNYQLLASGSPAKVDEWRCDPDTFFETDQSLDYSIVEVKPKNGKQAGDEWGYLNLANGATVTVGQRVNIVQHPQGRFKEIAFRDNQVRAVTGKYIQYLTDTDYGTSGSPVFDDWFNVVALHSRRTRDPNDPNRWYRNQGFLAEAIAANASL